MRETINVVKLNGGDYSYLMRILLDKRNELIREEKSIENINEMILKIADSKTKKEKVKLARI